MSDLHKFPESVARTVIGCSEAEKYAIRSRGSVRNLTNIISRPCNRFMETGNLCRILGQGCITVGLIFISTGQEDPYYEHHVIEKASLEGYFYHNFDQKIRN